MSYINKKIVFRYLNQYVLIALSFFYSTLSFAGVADTHVTDVTTRAFSLVWVSDEPVTTASIRVFSDIDGLNDITATFSLNTVSSNAALVLGIVKVDVVGVMSDTIYYVETITDGSSGQVVFPLVTEALIEVTTAIETTKLAGDGSLITNDLIIDTIITPNNTDPLMTGLLLVNVEGASYPVSSFVDENTLSPEAAGIVDLNNLFALSGSSLKLLGGEVMSIKKYRGLLCETENQIIEKNRKVPEHIETPVITELEQAAACFSTAGIAADFNCNNRIGLADLGKLAARFAIEQPDCRFNSDYDFNANGRIDESDLSDLIAVFGISAP